MSTSIRLNLNNGQLYGRTQELSQIREAHKRVAMGSKEVVIIEGPTGTGKSSLLDKSLVGEDVFVGGYNFDTNIRLNSSTAVSETLTELIDDICEDEDLVSDLAEEFNEVLTAREKDILTKLSPEFFQLLEDEDNDEFNSLSSFEFESVDDIEDLQEASECTLHFLRILTQLSEIPIVFRFENLQYADKFSLKLIEGIIHEKELQSILVIVTIHWMNLDFERENVILQWKERIQSDNETTKIIQLTLHELSIIEINKYLADLMNLDEGTTFPLSTLVMTRTNGNMYFVVKLLEHLQMEHLLYYDTCSYKWTWNLEQVQGTSLSEHMVEVVANRIPHHPKEVKLTLQLAACLGYKVDPQILDIIKSVLGISNLAECLKFCMDENILERLPDGRVKFLHERLHNIILKLLPDGKELTKLHFGIGAMLWNRIQNMSKEGIPVDDKLLFLCADNMSLGADHMSDAVMKLRLAKLFELVGIKAISVSAFSAAADYLEKGIDLLESLGNTWGSHYSLCSSIFLNYAEAQLYVGHFEESLDAILTALSHSPPREDRIRANLVHLYIFMSRGQMNEFISLALILLVELGEILPKYPSTYQVKISFQSLMKRLGELDDSELRKLPREDSRVIEVLMMMLVPLQALGMHKLLALAIFRSVTISINHGISQRTPEAFASLGAYLIAEKDDIAEGIRFGEISNMLAELIQKDTVNPRVRYWTHAFNKPWQMVPFVHSVDKMFEGHIAAMKQGDPFTAFLSVNSYFQLSYFSGLHLRPLLHDLDRFSTQIQEYGQTYNFLLSTPIINFISNLTCKDVTLRDETDDTIISPQGHDLETTIGRIEYLHFNMELAVFMSDITTATKMAKKLKMNDMGIMKAHFSYQIRVYYFALVSIANARLTGKRRFKVEAAGYILSIRRWVQKKVANLAHKLLILDAEYETLETKDGHVLQGKYDKAISSSKKAGFVQDAALAAQLAGRALRDVTGGVQTYAESYILKAQGLWGSWGATAIVEKLKLEYPESSMEDYSYGERGHHLSRQRFDARLSLEHQRRLSED
jgi:predicted ATPase